MQPCMKPTGIVQFAAKQAEARWSAEVVREQSATIWALQAEIQLSMRVQSAALVQKVSWHVCMH